jgi:hypothetical protein
MRQRVRNILWHTDLLLSNNCETDNKTTAIATQQPGRHNGSTVGIGIFYVVRTMAISCNWLS